MSQINSKPSWDDELLSAFVDGELTDVERAQVEQRLANDPEARRFVAELQELSASLQALPLEKVGRDLRVSVLEYGERMLAEGPSVPRRWMWVALAMAAALMLTVYLPEVQQEKPLLAEKQKVEGGLRQAAPELRAKDSTALGSGGEEIDKSSEAFSEMVAAPAASADRDESPEAIVVGRALAKVEVASKPLEFPSDYRVHVTFTRAEQFTKLLKDQGLAFHPLAGRQKQIEKSVQEDQILVEAAPDQIERLLANCHADLFACQSIRLVGTKSGAEQHPSWYRWQRLGRVAKNEALRESSASSVEEEKGVSIGSRRSSNNLSQPRKRSVAGEGDNKRTDDERSPAEPSTAAVVAQSGRAQKAQPIRVLFHLQVAPSP